MQMTFTPITSDHVKTIAMWRYKGAVRRIDMSPYFRGVYDEKGHLLGPEACVAYVVLRGEELLGLFEYYTHEPILSIGLALNPKFKNRGLGPAFVERGLIWANTLFEGRYNQVKLLVDKKNKPAIRVYEKTGFRKWSDLKKEWLMTRDMPQGKL